MRTSPLPGFMKKGCGCTGTCRCSSPLKANSQGLEPQALADKRARDKRKAMEGDRKEKKAQNQRIGQRSDSDLHHTGSGVKRVSIKNNRGFFGRGTKNE